MWVTVNGGLPLARNTPTSNVYNAKNQIGGVNYQAYDGAGNEESVNGDWMTYDAENRQTSETV